MQFLVGKYIIATAEGIPSKKIENTALYPIYRVVSANLERVSLELCLDENLYFSNSAAFFSKTIKLSKKMKKTIMDEVLYESKRVANSFAFVPRLTSYGFLRRSSNFSGIIIDDFSNDDMLALLKDINKPNYYVYNETNYLVVKDYSAGYRNVFGAVCLNLLTGKLELLPSIYRDKEYILSETNDVYFVSKKCYSLLKKAKLICKNICVESDRFTKVYDGQKHEVFIKDNENGIYYTQEKFLSGEIEERLNIEEIKDIVGQITNKIRKTTNNVYCCARIDRCSSGNGFGQMSDHYDDDIPGFIIHIDKGFIETGLLKRAIVTTNLHNSHKEIVNDKKMLRGKKIVDCLSSLGVDTLYVYHDTNKNCIEKSNNGKSLELYIPLEADLVQTYKSFSTKSTTDWAKVPMSDLWC